MPRHRYQTGRSGSGSVAVGDLNGDRKPDLVSAGGGVSVFLGGGDGSFLPRRHYATGDLGSVAIADLTGDGRPDLALGDGGVAGARQQRRRLRARARLRLPRRDATVAVGELNGDKRLDLAAVNMSSRNGASSFAVLINTPGLCDVQYVVGLTLAAAKRALAHASCRLGRVTRFRPSASRAAA